MSQVALGGFDVVLTDTMVENGLPGFAHSELADLAVWRQLLLKQGFSPENCRRVEAVADVTTGAWQNGVLKRTLGIVWGSREAVSLGILQDNKMRPKHLLRMLCVRQRIQTVVTGDVFEREWSPLEVAFFPDSNRRSFEYAGVYLAALVQYCSAQLREKFNGDGLLLPCALPPCTLMCVCM